MTTKPVIFIGYSHNDATDSAGVRGGSWLSYIQSFLVPANKAGVFMLWSDKDIVGDQDLQSEVRKKLDGCDIYLLLVSRYSLASSYIASEIQAIRARTQISNDVSFFPIVVTPVPAAALRQLSNLNLRPMGGVPLSEMSPHQRDEAMIQIANEIADLAAQIAERKTSPGRDFYPAPPTFAGPRTFIHITHLPDTAYENLVGRDAELDRLDEAWADHGTNIISLIAEGGAGKSALVNEWLKRMQADNYRGADAVLGWSFYSQGSKERAMSAEAFLNWALDKLAIKIGTTSSRAKGEAIAETLMRRRVLLVLDGVEPLQQGLGGQQGQLKDQGLRALLRRFAATPPAAGHGLVVLTSRLAVKDIALWQNGAAPVVDVERLSDESGAELLRDNGVWGTDNELRSAAQDFGGHPLALGLLASFLRETQTGDVRRRDHIRAFWSNSESPGHDQAKRIMESYEAWLLKDQPALLAIMQVVGLFDRPASGDCLTALRRKPAIVGLTDHLIDVDDAAWQRAVTRLREVRLLAPCDPSAPDALDAHPLVREWLGERLQRTSGNAWVEAQNRLYEHLRDSTKEGRTPPLEDLAPLYQAIVHGCRAGRHQEVLDDIYVDRICRMSADGGIEFYASRKLGAIGSDLAAVSWFFNTPYYSPVTTLTEVSRSWVLGQAAFLLRAQGRFVEALQAQRASVSLYERSQNWAAAAISAANLTEVELLVGNVPAASDSAAASVAYADRSAEEFRMMAHRTALADVLHAAGRRADAEALFADAERRNLKLETGYPLLISLPGYKYCDLLIAKGDWRVALERAARSLEWGRQGASLLALALDRLTLGRAHLGLLLASDSPKEQAKRRHVDIRTASDCLNDAVEGLRMSGQNDYVVRGLLARAVLSRSVGDWNGAARDLDEVEEIAEPGPMRLFLCDMALERARLAFALIEAFAPVNGLIDDSPPKPERPSEAESKSLQDEAAKQLAIAADYIKTCGYHRRDEELAELQAVLAGECTFASLPPRV